MANLNSPRSTRRGVFCCVIFVVWIFCFDSGFVLVFCFKWCEMCLKCFHTSPHRTQVSSIPKAALWEHAVMFTHVFPTAVKSVSGTTGNNKILAEHFSFTGHMPNAISIKEKKKQTYMDQTKWIFSKASLKDGTPPKGPTRKTNILAGHVAIRQWVKILN